MKKSAHLRIKCTKPHNLARISRNGHEERDYEKDREQEGQRNDSPAAYSPRTHRPKEK